MELEERGKSEEQLSEKRKRKREREREECDLSMHPNALSLSLSLSYANVSLSAAPLTFSRYREAPKTQSAPPRAESLIC